MFKAPPRSCWHIPRGRLIVRWRCDSFSGGATVHFFVALGCKLFNFFFNVLRPFVNIMSPSRGGVANCIIELKTQRVIFFLFRRRNRIIYLPCLYPFLFEWKKEKKTIEMNFEKTGFLIFSKESDIKCAFGWIFLCIQTFSSI